MTDPAKSSLIERLRSTLPVCPYDQRSPDYYTAPDDKPCPVCGSRNDVNAPDLCRGADTSCMTDAANEIERLLDRLARAETLVADARRFRWVASLDHGGTREIRLSGVKRNGDAWSHGISWNRTSDHADIRAAIDAEMGEKP